MDFWTFVERNIFSHGFAVVALLLASMLVGYLSTRTR